VVVWTGDGRPGKHNRQSLFFAYALLAVREAAATPLEKGNIIAAPSPRPRARSDGTCCRQPCKQLQGTAMSTASCINRTTATGFLAYTSLRTLSTFYLLLITRLLQGLKSMRSGCQNITLAIAPSDGVPCRHGYAPLITPGTLGTDSPRNPSLH